MQVDLHADSTECDDESGRSSSAPRRKRLVAAGVAMAGAGVLAVNPVTSTPAMPAIAEIREAAVELAAFENPFAVWHETITNTLNSRHKLTTDISAASTALTLKLIDPAVYEELANFLVGSVTNPLGLATALIDFPSAYGGRIMDANGASFEALQEALTTLPTALQSSLGYLVQGEFLEAFSVLNVWLLVDLLSDARQELVDNGLLAIPGDFAESVGASSLARVLDALINRGMLGNFGRAWMTAQVTSTIQTMEILDRTRVALLGGDFETAASELINAPAKVTNAFLNGYLPDFTVDYPPSPNQTFPGLLHPLGFFSFFAVQVPNAIATALTPPPPPAEPASPTTVPPAAAIAATEDAALTPDVSTGPDVGSKSVSRSRSGATGSGPGRSLDDSSLDDSGLDDSDLDDAGLDDSGLDDGALDGSGGLDDTSTSGGGTTDSVTSDSGTPDSGTSGGGANDTGTSGAGTSGGGESSAGTPGRVQSSAGTSGDGQSSAGSTGGGQSSGGSTGGGA